MLTNEQIEAIAQGYKKYCSDNLENQVFIPEHLREALLLNFELNRGKQKMLTNEQIETISKKYIKCCGGHWENEDAIPEHLIEYFVRDIEKSIEENTNVD